VDAVEGRTGILEAVVHGVLREIRIVFPPCEALFLRGGDDHPVVDEGRGAVVIER
jgi:hypothetical protein